MTHSSRPELFDSLSKRIVADVQAVNPTLDPVDVDVFFADELLFASATVRTADGGIHWRSSHAATPDSTSIADLAESGNDLIARITADAQLAAVVDSTGND